MQQLIAKDICWGFKSTARTPCHKQSCAQSAELKASATRLSNVLRMVAAWQLLCSWMMHSKLAASRHRGSR